MWQQIGKLTASDAMLFDYLGESVGLSGDTAVVGAYGASGGGADSGSAYVFREVGGVWQQIAKLAAADQAGPIQFGTSAALSGDTTLIGAPLGAPNGVGGAYVFARASDCNSNGIPDDCDITAGTSGDCNANGVPDECEPDSDSDGLPNGCDSCAGGAASGDTDADGLLDLDDFADLASCLLGPGGGLGAGCECFDFDSDGDNDLLDFAAFQATFTGN